MVYFAYKYRERPGLKAKYITHNVPLEIVWTAVPFVLLMVIFGWGYVVYNAMRQVPSNAYEVKVVGKQWLWQFQYDDGRTTVNELFVPVNKPVKLVMTSTDVLHSFFIPNFRIKQDVVPGMYSHVWFEATLPGRHQIYCTEYCGTSHSLMLARVNVLTPPQWEDWKLGKKLGEIPEAGAELPQTMSAAPSSGGEVTVSMGAGDSTEQGVQLSASEPAAEAKR
jgi:cytochrome c oxidase subunit 2